MQDHRSQPGSQLPQLWSQTALAQARPVFDLPPDDDGFSLKQYLALIAGHRRLILSTTLVVLAIAALEVFTATTLFRSTTTVQINPEDAKVLPYEDLGEATVSGRAMDQYLSTLARNLTSRTLARRVIDDLALTEDPDFIEAPSRGVLTDQVLRLKRALAARDVASEDGEQGNDTFLVNRLLEHLQVRGLGSTRLVEVSYSSPDPRLSANIANALIEQFIEHRFEVRYQSASRAADFLEKQLSGVKEKLEASEQAVIKYAREHDIVNVGENDDTINRQRLEDMSSELTRVENALNAERAIFQSIGSATVEDFPQQLKDASILDLEARLSNLRQELAALSDVHGPMWPEVRQSRVQVAELEQQLRAEKEQVLTSARESYRTKVAQRSNLLAEIDNQKRLVDDLNDASIEYKILQREVDTNKELYDGLLQRLKEAGVSASLRANNIEVVDVAEPSRRGSEPDKPFALGVAALLGLILGIFGAVLVERGDQSLKSPEEANHYLGVPVLGAIPDLTEQPRRIFGLAALFSRKRPDKSDVPIVAFNSDDKGRMRAAEGFRAVRTALLLSHPDKTLSTILVSSSLDNEGKSTTALNLAIALAKNGSRTLLVDLDLRRAQLTGHFDAHGRAGLSTHLSGNSDLAPEVMKTSFADLYFLPSGPPPPNPAELIGAQRMDSALELLTGLFDTIVFDTPPALEISDAFVLARKVDGVVLVSQSGRTRRRTVRTVVRRFILIGANVVGVVLNKVKGSAEDYGYGYGEYSYYSQVPHRSEFDATSAEKSA